MGKKRIRVEFRKKYGSRTRDADLTKDYGDTAEEIDTVRSERISGKGDLTRHRTVVGQHDQRDPTSKYQVMLGLDESAQPGVVLRVHGLECVVRSEQGPEYRCAVRGLLKTLSTDQRHVVVAGDRVQFRPEGTAQGLILRIEPRQGTLSRTSRNRQHVIVANVDQLLIVASAAEPHLKPNLIDRFLVSAEQNHLDACVCINKCDLVDPAELQPTCGVLAQAGYRVLLVSAARQWGIDDLRSVVRDRRSVVVGQSGVGKSTLLNAMDPGLQLRVQTVSQDNSKGRHTTTTAEVYPLADGGAIIDTPGIRQFRLWNIVPEELSGLFRDLRPFANHCRYPNCTHRHETDCAVKDAVADGMLDVRRYESYCHIMNDDPDDD
jgi:ribosome biogenesis GTPase